MNKTKGFTLIELLVVIAIIGVLASVVLNSMQEARFSAQYTVAMKELKLIQDALMLAGDSGQPTKDITGSGCSECACRTTNGAPEFLPSATDGSSCMTRWRTTLQNIANNSPVLNNNVLPGLERDPWGSPYLLDENELEFSGNPCRRDRLWTAGADGIRSTSDDYHILMPFRTPECQ